jgi:hypothetical protein
VKRKRLIVRLIGDVYHAHYPDNPEVAEALGTATLPTPFMRGYPTERILAELLINHPDHLVTLEP